MTAIFDAGRNLGANLRIAITLREGGRQAGSRRNARAAFSSAAELFMASPIGENERGLPSEKKRNDGNAEVFSLSLSFEIFCRRDERGVFAI